MLQQEEPQDFVLSTNECHSVREYVEKAFAVVGKTIRYWFDLIILITQTHIRV